MTVVVFILLALFATCSDAADDTYYFAEVTQMATISSDDWIGEYPTKLSVGHVWMWSSMYVRAEVAHMSNVDRGRPFNNKPESNLDTAGVTVGVRW